MRVGAAVHAVAVAEDGHWLLAGSERDLRLLDRQGNVRYRLGAADEGRGAGERPFSALAVTPDFGLALVIERSGRLYRLSVSTGADPRSPIPLELWHEPNDLYSLSLQEGRDRPAAHGMAVIGHLGPALTAIDLAGRPLWRHHPDSGVGTEGRSWVVALDGEMVYAGCSAGRHYSVLGIEAVTGLVRAARICPQPVTLVAALPDRARSGSPRGDRPAVVAVQTRNSTCEVSAYMADLAGPAWRYRPEPGEVVTALAAWGGLVALGTNTGCVILLRADSGRLLVRQDLLFSSTVLSLSMAGRRPGPARRDAASQLPAREHAAGHAFPDAAVAAGLANGTVAYLDYFARGRIIGQRLQEAAGKRRILGRGN